MYKITKDLMPIYMRSNMDYKYGLQILVYNFYNPHKIEVKKITTLLKYIIVQ